MSEALCLRLFQELDWLPLVDPHTHINPHAPAAANLAEILGYHYYTELAHSAGMPRAEIEQPDLAPREKVRRLAAWLPQLDNTIQSSWLVEMARSLFGFEDDHIGPHNWEAFYDLAEAALGRPDWTAEVLKRSRLKAVFLTNDFDDPLSGFDPHVFVPCLRTDELVFQLVRPAVRERLERERRVGRRSSGPGRGAGQVVRALCRPGCPGLRDFAAVELCPHADLGRRFGPRSWRRFGAAVNPPMRTRGASWPISSSGRWPSTAPRFGCHST